MRDIALALLIFGMLPFILKRPYWGLLAWSWLGYMNPNRLCFGFAVSFPWVQLIAIVTLVGLAFSKESKKIPKSTISVLLFLLLMWTGVTTFYAAVPDSAWSKWQEFAKVLIMVFVTLMMVNNRERIHWLIWIIVVSLGFYGLKGGLFTVMHGGRSNVLGPPNSFIADNNALALALCMTLPLMRYLQLHSPLRVVRIGMGIAMLFTGIAVLGTYSRGGLIGLAIVAGALFLKSRRRLAVVLVAVAVGLAAYHFMPPEWAARMDTLHQAKETSSGESRIQSWKFAANVAIHHPLVGGGFDDYLSTPLWDAFAPDGAEPRAVHSIYFRVLGEQGFPGLILFLALMFASWRSCSRVRKNARDLPDQKWAYDLASMLQVALIAFMAAGAFLPMTYFDLSYQLIAVCALLGLHAQEGGAQLTGERSHGLGVAVRSPPVHSALAE
ncbi:putative O-glycosylation ligase, exosortase A system-associated [Rhodanobacter sp. KK11]|jgi:probable O-glycosylation ligase (exosortase A-associated)|uniref:putative O-glycosylation ligase, exosortase A system-associated n=1 Tax=Rhodanobacter sp. KK11 TaxID=3083255 RepID=UPI0029671EB6|nr:putative O-glycosylation ligase, exosortase A system-associated [Rhodanobacter sp. KK11]MDW2983304.1 putative O-glycosylation ligase, exosortase A system-associated [Rhodanobacter sp. KK11]